MLEEKSAADKFYIRGKRRNQSRVFCNLFFGISIALRNVVSAIKCFFLSTRIPNQILIFFSQLNVYSDMAENLGWSWVLRSTVAGPERTRLPIDLNFGLITLKGVDCKYDISHRPSANSYLNLWKRPRTPQDFWKICSYAFCRFLLIFCSNLAIPLRIGINQTLF